MKEIITASMLFLIAVLAFFMSIRSFREKGFLFNNAYLYASEKERETMNKKPHYRQSAIVFLLLGFVFLLNGFAALFHRKGKAALIAGIQQFLVEYSA